MLIPGAIFLTAPRTSLPSAIAFLLPMPNSGRSNRIVRSLRCSLASRRLRIATGFHRSRSSRLVAEQQRSNYSGQRCHSFLPPPLTLLALIPPCVHRRCGKSSPGCAVQSRSTATNPARGDYQCASTRRTNRLEEIIAAAERCPSTEAAVQAEMQRGAVNSALPLVRKWRRWSQPSRSTRSRYFRRVRATLGALALGGPSRG